MSKCAGGVQCPIGDTANVYSSVCFLESEKKQLNFKLLEKTGCSVICCTGCDSDTSSSETNEVTECCVSDSSATQPQPGDSFVQVVSTTLPQSAVISLNHFVVT